MAIRFGAYNILWFIEIDNTIYSVLLRCQEGFISTKSLISKLNKIEPLLATLSGLSFIVLNKSGDSTLSSTDFRQVRRKCCRTGQQFRGIETINGHSEKLVAA